MEHRSAFSRAWATLAGHRGHPILARLAGGLAAVLMTALLGILALFVDLLIAKGHVPAEHELAHEQRAAFAASLGGFTGERRAEALATVGVPTNRSNGFDVPFEKLTAL